MLGSGQSLILTQRHFRTEQEVRKRSLVEHAVHNDRRIPDLKIKPIFFRTITVKHPSVALDSAKPLAIEFLQILPAYLELVQKLQLLKRPKTRKLGRADLVEHNLQHAAKLHPFPLRGKAQRSRAHIIPSP